MNLVPHPRPWACTLFLRLAAPLLLLLCLPVFSQAQRRPFTGSYHFANIKETDDKVVLTLFLTLHNFSGNDIANGSVALYSSDGPNSIPIDSFRAIKRFPSYKDVTVTHEFVVPRRDYEQWSHGQEPNLRFVLTDPDGGTRVLPIDLRRELRPCPRQDSSRPADPDQKKHDRGDIL